MSQKKSNSSEQNELFAPPKDFSKQARVKSMAQYKRMYAESIEKPSKFWATEAADLCWQKKWSKVLEWKAPYSKWFTGAKLNIAENCLERHITAGRGNKAAIIWEGELGRKETITYSQLLRRVCKFSNILLQHGVKAKDRGQKNQNSPHV